MKNHPTKHYYLFSAAFFTISVISGYVLEAKAPFARQIIQEFVGFANLLKGVSSFELFVIIFLNNSIKMLFAMLLGVFFGILPLYMLYFNGLVLGITISLVTHARNYTVAVAGILPHGVFEIAAMIIASSYGLWLGASLIQRLKKDPKVQLPIKRALKIYGMIVIPLLLVAALIEVYITPIFLNMAMK